MSRNGSMQPSRTARVIKDAAAFLFSKIDKPILVNSFGRSGSTLLHDSLVESAAIGEGGLRRWSEKLIRGYAWDLERTALARGRCYKTHDYPPTTARRRVPRVVYIFGDPVAATISLLRQAERCGKEWHDSHCRQLRVPPCPIRDVIERDALRIEGHLKAWLAQRRWPTAFVRYERLWENAGVLSEFLGFELSLSAKRERTSYEPDHALRAKLERTYARVSDLVRDQPDYQLIVPSDS